MQNTQHELVIVDLDDRPNFFTANVTALRATALVIAYHSLGKDVATEKAVASGALDKRVLFVPGFPNKPVDGLIALRVGTWSNKVPKSVRITVISEDPLVKEAVASVTDRRIESVLF